VDKSIGASVGSSAIVTYPEGLSTKSNPAPKSSVVAALETVDVDSLIVEVPPPPPPVPQSAQRTVEFTASQVAHCPAVGVFDAPPMDNFLHPLDTMH
jgi:hypothetical protein